MSTDRLCGPDCDGPGCERCRRVVSDPAPTPWEQALSLLRSDSLTRAEKDAAEATVRKALAPKDAEIERHRTIAIQETTAALKERNEARAALAAKDAEIERLRARLKSNREMYQRGHAAGFREAAEWLEETLRAKKEAGVWPNWMEPAARALRAEADRREGKS